LKGATAFSKKTSAFPNNYHAMVPEQTFKKTGKSAGKSIKKKIHLTLKSCGLASSARSIYLFLP
jgi:hypothetical protein